MATTPPTLADLERKFLAFLADELKARRCSDRTIRYYRHQLGRFVAAAGGDRPADQLRPFDLRRHAVGWHAIQAVQRLYNWAVDAELLAVNPIRKVPRPPLGQRRRVLRPAELARLLRAARPALRRLLVAIRFTLGRPQELRAVRWSDYREDLGAFVLADFKARDRRKDGAAARVLVVPPRLARLLARLRRRRPPSDAHVFLGDRGRPWTANALRLAVRRAARRAGLDQVGEEHVVAYTLRHTGATAATAAGVRDRLLADLMGHASTRTTARYQHLQLEDLAEGIRRATQRRRA